MMNKNLLFITLLSSRHQGKQVRTHESIQQLLISQAVMEDVWLVSMTSPPLIAGGEMPVSYAHILGGMSRCQLWLHLLFTVSYRRVFFLRLCSLARTILELRCIS